MKNFTKSIVKSFLVTCVILFSGGQSFSQAPDWLWGIKAGASGNEETYSIAVDKSGNIYAAGYFSSTSITFGSTTLTSTGFSNVFLVKYDASGNVLWAKGSAGSQDDDNQAYAVAVDSSDNVIVTGFFLSTTITFGLFTLTNAGSGSSGDIFVVKYNSSGTEQWAKRAGDNNGDESGWSIATDGGDNVYLAGNFSGSTLTFGTTALNNAGPSFTQDMFLVKYSSSGTIVWAKRAGGMDEDIAYSVTTDNSGSVLLTGWFQSSSITFGTTVLTNADSLYSDVFLAKYDGSGNSLWAKRAGGVDDDKSRCVIADKSGNIFMTGFFRSSSIVFGSSTLNNANTGYSDVFVAKYSSAGNPLWANGAGSFDDEEAMAVASDMAGNCIVTGWFLGQTLDFGSSTLTNASMGSSDLFVVKYDGSGGQVWTQSAGGTYDDTPDFIATDAAGDIYVSGYFLSDTLTFGPSALVNAGSSDMFLAKLTSSVGIKQPAVNSDWLRIYSNPVATHLNLEISEAVKGTAALQIFDAVGKEVYNEMIVEGSVKGITQIDVSALRPGIYFLQMKSETGVIAKKFMKE